jgi:sulfide:quinone oxidoreductase
MSVLKAFELKAAGDDFCYAAQIQPEDIAAITAAGFRSLICNRPDAEEGAVDSSLIKAAAEAAGLKFVYMPVLFSTLAASDGNAFREFLNGLPTPILAYCRTGRRCAALWAFARVAELGLDQTLAFARQSGSDLEELRARLSQPG